MAERTTGLQGSWRKGSTFSKAPLRVLPLLCALALSCSGCAPLSEGFLFSPAGPVAVAERHEALIVGIVLVFVFAPVALLVPLFAWYYRIGNKKAAYRPQWAFSWVLEFLIWVPPTALVVLLSVVLARYTVLLDPYRPIRSGAATPPLEVQVVALDWKWLFIYPAQHVATVNTLVVPAGRPVHLSLTSGTVMQSLFMPRLASQIYAMSGMRTQLNFEVAKPGLYAGENTQYNGDGFAEDKFTVNALSPAGFANWASQLQAQPQTLDAPAYTALSVQSVLKTPPVYGRVEPDIFNRILAGQIPAGYSQEHQEQQQHHESGNG